MAKVLQEELSEYEQNYHRDEEDANVDDDDEQVFLVEMPRDDLMERNRRSQSNNVAENAEQQPKRVVLILPEDLRQLEEDAEAKDLDENTQVCTRFTCKKRRNYFS